MRPEATSPERPNGDHHGPKLAAYDTGEGQREALEADHGCPVVASNHATLWDAVRPVGADASGIPGGRLFRTADATSGARFA